MNIFNKVAIHNLKKNRTRTLVTIVGVILSAAMITAVATFALSLQTYMIKGAISKYGSWHVSFSDVNSQFLQRQSSDSRISSAVKFENIGYGLLKGGKNPDKPYVFIAGFNKETFDALPLDLISGRLPENSGEIMIPSHVASNGGVNISIGNKISLSVGNRMKGKEKLNQHDPYVSSEDPDTSGEILTSEKEKTYTVVGIYQRPSFEERTAPGYTLITADTSGEAADSFTSFAELKHPSQIRSYAESEAGSSPYIFNDDVLRFMGLSGDHTFNMLLYSIGIILIVLIMIGSIFMIYNSFTISLSERMSQLGILLSVGATQKQITKSVLFEGFCIGLIGIPIGILTGIPGINLVLSLTEKNFTNIMYDDVPLDLIISIPFIAGAAVISMITILISAYIPAKRAAGASVMECIRQSSEIKVNPLSASTPKFFDRIWGLEGTLALKSFKRNRRRYRSIVLSLTLSVVLFVCASSFGTHLKQSTGDTITEDIDYDICFFTEDMDEKEVFHLYDDLKQADKVYDSSYQALSSFSCTVDAEKLSDDFRSFLENEEGDEERAASDAVKAGESIDLLVDMQFIEDSVFLKYIKSLGLSPSEYTGKNGKMVAAAKFKKTANEKEQGSRLMNLFSSSSMGLEIRGADEKETIETLEEKKANGKESEASQTVELTFVDETPVDTLPKQYSEMKSYVFRIVAPYSMKSQLDPLNAQTCIGLTFHSEQPSRSIDKMKLMIQGQGITSPYTLYNVYEIFDQNRNILFVVNLFTVVFVIMISLIATANVFNTISTNIKLRRRELAMLRSVGMADRDFNRMIRFECLLYGLQTLLFGIPISAILSWLIYKGLTIGGAETDFLFPWVSMAISILGVFLLIFITMIYGVRRIKRENIIHALRDDMI